MAIGGLDQQGKRRVFFELNGQPREVAVTDESCVDEISTKPKADPSNDLEYGASMPGKITQINVKIGQTVMAGDTLLLMEAMKMETAIIALTDGDIESLEVALNDQVGAGDLLLRMKS